MIRLRLVTLISVAVVAGACSAAGSDEWVVFLALAVLGVLYAVQTRHRAVSLVRVLVALAMFWPSFALASSAIRQSAGDQIPAGAVVVTGTVRSASDTTTSGATTFLLAVDSLEQHELHHTVTLDVRLPDRRMGPSLGQRVTASGHIQAPRPPLNPGEERPGPPAPSLLLASDVQVLATRTLLSQWGVLTARIRQNIERKARPLLSYYSFGFAEELLLHQHLFGIPEKQLFSATGTSHLLSISGLHLSLIFAIASALAGLALRERRTGRLLLPLLATFGYLAFIDFPLSADRAFVMLCIFTLAQVSGSHHGTLESLSWAALLLTLVDPLSVFDIGLQLSLASVAGLAFIGRPLARFAHARIRVVPGLVSSLCSTTGASMATTALVVSTFHLFAPISLLANLIAIPAVSMLLVFMLSWTALLLVARPLAILIAPLVNIASQLIIWFLRLCSRLPGSHFNVAAPPSFVLWSAGMLLAMVILIVDNQPRFGHKGRAAGVAAACVGLALCTWPLWAHPAETCATFPVVDQGSAVLIRDRNIGTWFCLEDSTATSMNRAARAVAALGVTRPDTVVLSGCPSDIPTQLDILFEILAPTRVYVPSDSIVTSLPGLEGDDGITIRQFKQTQSIVTTGGATTIRIEGSDGSMTLGTRDAAGVVGRSAALPALAPSFSYDTLSRTLLVRSVTTLQSFQSDQVGCVTLRLTGSACQVAPDSRR